MNTDRPAVPAEQEALDKPWRTWATIAVVAFTFVSLILGFWVVPESKEPGFDPFAAMCRSIGIPGFERSDAPPATTAPEPQASNVTWTADSRTLLAEASVKQGAEIAASSCFACHGKDGVGIAPTYPNLTHQSAAAIFKQLNDYKAGVRTGGMAAVMQPMVVGLDSQQMANVAAYYASLEPRTTRYGEDPAPGIYRLVKIGSPVAGTTAMRFVPWREHERPGGVAGAARPICDVLRTADQRIRGWRTTQRQLRSHAHNRKSADGG